MADYLLQEDGSSHVLEEDGSGAFLLETSAAAGEVDVPFIGTVTAVYALTFTLELDVPFISSATVVNGIGRVRHNPDFVASTTNTPVGGGDANDLSVPAGVIAGDLLVAVFAASDGSLAALSCSGWTQQSHIDGSGGGPSLSVFTKAASASEPSSYHFGGITVHGGNACLAYRGIQAETPDAITLGTGLTAASLTPHEADDLQIYIGATGSDSSLSGPDGFTLRVFFTDIFQGVGLLLSDTVNDGVSATGTVTPNGSGGSNANTRYGHVLFIRQPFEIDPPFISTVTIVYPPGLPFEIDLPFIASVAAVYTPDLPEVRVPFIATSTHVFGVFSSFDPDRVFTGPGNGGEGTLIALAPNGTSVAATLAANISTADALLTLTGYGSLPASDPFCLRIDTEILYVVAVGAGAYRIRGRAVGNTTSASHTAGAAATWTDSYDMAIGATEDIAASFTADITGSGSSTYPGWLLCFDSSQAYLAGSRYPMHVTEVVGVFPAGTGVAGTNRLDAAQPNAISSPTGISDDCPAALSNPARIASNITTGDVAVVRYTNQEASVLLLGPRSAALQSWFGMKRVDNSDADVTLTDPNGIVVDTTAGEGTFTGSVNGEWAPPVLGPGIGPDTGLPTNHDVPYTSVTLPGADRNFTRTVEKGWPICCLAVRQGKRRVPYWESWDWRNYNYVYTGFDTDATYSQIVINRNGIVFGSVPEVALPGTQDIDGPDAVWDDGSYYFGASWYVAIYQGPYLVIGPSIGGAGIGGGGISTTTGFVPIVSFPAGAGGTAHIDVPSVEGGAGGGIAPPLRTDLFQVAHV